MYRVVIKRQALKEISWLPQHIQEQIKRKIDALKSDPRPFGSKKITQF